MHDVIVEIGMDVYDGDGYSGLSLLDVLRFLLLSSCMYALSTRPFLCYRAAVPLA